MPRSLTLAVLSALVLALAGCGGGGNGGAGGPLLGPGTFSGTYWFVLIEAESSGPSAHSQWGTAVADGVGNLTLTTKENTGVTVTGPATDNFTYTVATDGTLVVLEAAVEVVRGGISADGGSAVLASSSTVGDPVLIVMTKVGGTFSAASLTGDYHISGTFHVPQINSLFSTKVTMDGISAYTGSGASNQEGVLDGGPISGAYTVAVDGTSTLQFFVDPYEGCVFQGNQLALYGGSADAGDGPGILAFVRAGSGLSTGTLSGAYWIVGLEYENSGSNFSSFYGSVFADALGTATVAGTSYDETTLTPFTGTAGYTVAPDGTVVLNRGGPPGTEDLTGAVSPDGRFVTIGGGALTGSNSAFFVLCRK